MSTKASSPTSAALAQWIRWGLLALLALLPLHAFGVTVLGSALGLTSADHIHPAFALLQAWKELLLATLLVLAVWRSVIDRTLHLRFLAVDAIVLGIAAVALFHLPISTGWYNSWLLGLRTDAEFLLPFYLARTIPWNAGERRALISVLLGSIGVALLFALFHGLAPADWLTGLGYSPYVSSWVPGKPLPLFHGVGEEFARRWMSSFSGPNQFGAYLLLVLGLAVGTLLAHRGEDRAHAHRWAVPAAWGIGAFALIALALTGSRSAVLGLAVLIGVTVLLALRTRMQRLVVILAATILGAGAVGGFALLAPERFDAVVLRSGSTNDHVVKFLDGLTVVREHPAGLGLGQAGPISMRTRRFEIGGDGGLTSESWYLQIAQELGVIGLLLYLGLLATLIGQALRLARAARDPDLRALSIGLALGLLGAATQALVLHTFADNTPLTLTLFTLSGIIAERTATFVAPTSTLKSKALHALSRATQHEEAD